MERRRWQGSAVIPRRKALALVAAGSHYITNFDAASARQAARGRFDKTFVLRVEATEGLEIVGQRFELGGLKPRERFRCGCFELLVGLGTIEGRGFAQAGKPGSGNEAEGTRRKP